MFINVLTHKMKFYINSLPNNCELDNINKCYSFVDFCISRYGRIWHTLKFDDPVSEEEAIERVEEYLSQPVDDTYYNRVKSNLFPGITREELVIRRDALGDCVFIERITVVVDGEDVGVKIWCGS